MAQPASHRSRVTEARRNTPVQNHIRRACYESVSAFITFLKALGKSTRQYRVERWRKLVRKI